MANADISEPVKRPIRPLGPVPHPLSGLVLKPKACIYCRTRKVKCDRKTPCGNCTRWSVDCVFPSPIRKCRRPRKATAGSSAGSESTSPAGGDRSTPPELMQRLEATLQAMEEFMKAHRTGTAARLVPCQSRSNGRRLSVGTGSWEDLHCNLKGVSELVAGLTGNGSLTPPELRAPTLLSGLSSAFGALSYPAPQPFPIDSFKLDVSPFHPPSAQIRTLWQAFLQNIDPLVKVLHTQATERILHKVMGDPTSLTDGETAIVFTIYFSVSSLPEVDSERCFGISKQAAHSVFKSAAEHAVTRLSTDSQNDLTSLQAFVLFLSLGRFTDHAPRVWALTGLVRRLEYISAWKSTSPFEEEMRRRLRWELWCLDHRAHEDSGRGSAPPDTGGAPQLPLNVRDADLDPSITEAPRLKPGWTEISFSLVRFEIARTARTIELLPSVLEKLAMVDECEQRVEGAYLRFCDGSEPIHWLARHVAHVLLMELRFKLLRYDRHAILNTHGYTESRMPLAQEDLFLQAIDIVDTPRRVETEPQAERWSWLLVGYMQFWPLSFLLQELRYRQGTQEVQRGWHVAEHALARRKADDMSENMETLRRLMAEARLERHSEISNEPRDASFIKFSQPLKDSSTTGFADLHTPTVFEPLVGEGVAGQGPDLTEDQNGLCGYMGLHDPFVPLAYDDLTWDGTLLPEATADEPFGFVFDDEDPLPGADASTAPPYSTHAM